MIYTTLRFISAEDLYWYTEDCLALKKEFPHIIAGMSILSIPSSYGAAKCALLLNQIGFDLVGHEDSLKPLIDYIEPLTAFVSRQKEVGVDIPFTFHAGETLGDGTAADVNLYDAILLGTKRIGHAYALISPLQTTAWLTIFN